MAGDHFAIVREKIDPQAIAAAVSAPQHGALAVFAGVVRERTGGGPPVRALLYDAYERMALTEFETIASEARERFGTCAVAMVHAVGEVRVGETSVLVAVGSAHRATALRACAYCIDELKRRAPIWKQEMYLDGTARWSS